MWNGSFQSGPENELQLSFVITSSPCQRHQADLFSIKLGSKAVWQNVKELSEKPQQRKTLWHKMSRYDDYIEWNYYDTFGDNNLKAFFYFCGYVRIKSSPRLCFKITFIHSMLLYCSKKNERMKMNKRKSDSIRRSLFLKALEANTSLSQTDFSMVSNCEANCEMN